MTMVVVTHEIQFAREVAHRVMFLDQGYVVEQGDAREVLTNPQSDRLQAFLSRMNQATGVRAQPDLTTPKVELRLILKLDKKLSAVKQTVSYSIVLT